MLIIFPFLNILFLKTFDVDAAFYHQCHFLKNRRIDESNCLT